MSNWRYKNNNVEAMGYINKHTMYTHCRYPQMYLNHCTYMYRNIWYYVHLMHICINITLEYTSNFSKEQSVSFDMENTQVIYLNSWNHQLIKIVHWHANIRMVELSSCFLLYKRIWYEMNAIISNIDLFVRWFQRKENMNWSNLSD